MTITIISIGNSKGIRIPKVLLEESGLYKNVELTAKKGEIRIIPASPKKALTASTMLSEKALSDWERSEEDKAWASLQ